jgi:photosystem II stability/assembly factor-like uncharacterized protein
LATRNQSPNEVSVRHPASPLACALFVSLLAIAVPPTAAAQGIAGPEGALSWRLLGPFRGGRVLAASGVPGQPDHYYFGAVNGGVWETVNAGRTWRPLFDGQSTQSIGALAISPSDPRVLYVGTGEADMRSDIAHGDGVYRSQDGGQRWVRIGLEDTRQIGRILVDPADSSRLFVAALGHAYGPNETRGVYRSTDAGTTWQKVLSRDADTGAIDLAFKPGDARTLYAALWQTRRPPWHIYPPSAGPGSGLYVSHDGGDNWSQISGHGFPATTGRIGIALAPSAPERVYAIVDAKDGGLYRSDDGGDHWSRVSDDARIWQRGWYFGGITVEPGNADIIYACNTALYRSTDGGHSFTPIKGAPGGDDYHTLWIDPSAPARRILGVDQGAVVSVDGGETWSSWFNQPTGQFYHVTTDRRFPYWVYGSQQDSGAAAVPSRTDTFDALNIVQFHELTAGGESDEIAPDPDDPEIVYGGRVERLDLRSGATRSIDPTLAYPDAYRRTWTLPLTFSRSGPKTLYFANQRLFATRDGGGHWTRLSPDLTRAQAAPPTTLDPATLADKEQEGDRHGVIYAIAPSPLSPTLLWVGTDDGLIWKSQDGGRHWRDVTPADLTPWSKVGIVEASQFTPGTAYAAIDRHRLDDDRPYIYRTHDGGASWQLAVSGIAAGNFVNVVREDPVRRGLLYAGTEHGVYVSQDDGDHWRPLAYGMPPSSVRDLEIHGSDLVAATHGRAFWILDDLSVLRHWDDAASARPMTLFPPADVHRLRPQGFTGSPMPEDEPRAENPPAGAVIDYYLSVSTPAPVVITIRDSAGRSVRRYASTDKPLEPEVKTLETAPRWTRTAPPPSAESGLHRLYWDLHYEALSSPASRKRDQDGLYAPPGFYTVELAVGGARTSRTLHVLPDPRLHLTAKDYAAAFAAARDVAALKEQIAIALGGAEKLHAALAPLSTDANAAVNAAARALDGRLLAVSDLELSKDRANTVGIPPTKLEALRALSARAEQLLLAVDGTDAAPSADFRRGYAWFAAHARAALSENDAIRDSGLAALNETLGRAGRATIARP